MATIKIAICDDEQSRVEEIASIWQDTVTEHFDYEIHKYHCAEDLLTSYNRGNKYDLLVLDIEMGSISGMEAARRIRTIDDDAAIIFITAYDRYVRDAFDVAAMHYLDKPIDVMKLKTLFRKCMKQYQEKHYAMIFSVYKTRNTRLREEIEHEEKVKVFLSEILYFESYNRLINVNLLSGELFQIKHKISDLEHELKSRNFVRIHKSYLVNVAYIRKITAKNVTLGVNRDQITLELSRKQKELVERVFLDYKLGDYKV